MAQIAIVRPTHSYVSFLEAEMNATRTFSLTRYYLFIKPFFFVFIHKIGKRKKINQLNFW